MTKSTRFPRACSTNSASAWRVRTSRSSRRAFGGDWPQKLGLPASVPDTTSFPVITNGYTSLGNPTVGFRGALTWDVTNTATLVLGNHSLKIGAEYRLLFGNNYQTSQPSGTFQFRRPPDG